MGVNWSHRPGGFPRSQGPGPQGLPHRLLRASGGLTSPMGCALCSGSFSWALARMAQGVKMVSAAGSPPTPPPARMAVFAGLSFSVQSAALHSSLRLLSSDVCGPACPGPLPTLDCSPSCSPAPPQHFSSSPLPRITPLCPSNPFSLFLSYIEWLLDINYLTSSGSASPASMSAPWGQ